jgi:hypothetical protein
MRAKEDLKKVKEQPEVQQVHLLVVPIVNHSLVDPSYSQVKTKYKTLPKIALKIYPV